jgi:hypothetical protein
MTIPPQLSAAVGAVNEVTEHWALTLDSAVTSGVGAVASSTVIVTEQVSIVKSNESVTVSITSTSPISAQVKLVCEAEKVKVPDPVRQALRSSATIVVFPLISPRYLLAPISVLFDSEFGAVIFTSTLLSVEKVASIDISLSKFEVAFLSL